MLGELRVLLSVVPEAGRRADYATAITDHDCLTKSTASTRRLANQRLGELYALDPSTPIFRVLRRMWAVDTADRPLLALLAAIARDPLLAASASAILDLHAGESMNRDRLTQAIRSVAGERLNVATLDKVVRNVASTWEQSGHLQGRTFKRRRLVEPKAASFTFALFLGYAAGFRGSELLTSPWVVVLDTSPSKANSLAQEAKRIGLIDFRMAGDVIAVGLERLDPSLREARR